jgi:hypothetical protein
MFVVALFMVIGTGLLSWAWVRGIDYMKENHPDYKGEDFLDCGEEGCVTKMAGRDGWDDSSIHSEGDF